MESAKMKITSLRLESTKGNVTAYSLKIDGELYRYQIFKKGTTHSPKVTYIAIESKTELYKVPLNGVTTKDFYCIKGYELPMNLTNPQQTIEQFYKILMLQ
jgi:hypothetical protein